MRRKWSCARISVSFNRWSRSAHDDLFHLYGRPPDTEFRNPAIDDPKKKELQRIAAAVPWKTALQCYFTHAYSNPDEVPQEVREKALKNLESLTRDHAIINYEENIGLGSVALSVCTSGKGSDVTLDAQYSCAFVLYRLGDYESCLDFVAAILDKKTHGTSAEQSTLLRISAIYAMCAVRLKKMMGRRLSRKVLSFLEMARSHYSNTQIAPQRYQVVVKSAELLVWALDWAFHEKYLPSLTDCDSEWADVTPPWLRACTFQASCNKKHAKDVSRIVCMRDTSPWQLHRLIQEHSLGKSDLEYLYQFCRDEEKKNADIVLFGLTVEAATALLKVDSRSSHAVEALKLLGSSLSPVVLSRCRSSVNADNHALHILSRMKGAQVYHALKKYLFHQPVSEQRRLQEQFGDPILSDPRHVPNGEPLKAATWSEALQSLANLAKSGCPWQSAIPSTLRLLSDAGKNEEFFSLLSDFNCNECSTQNLCVASALGHAARRSGRWWHALEILDLISNSPVPQNDEHEGYLVDACLQGLHALRTARKWEEALAFFVSLQPVVPLQGHRWMFSMGLDLPEGAPWKDVLQALSRLCVVPEAFRQVQECLYNDGPLPRNTFLRHQIVGYFVQHGHWEKVLAEAHNSHGKTRWNQVLRAGHHSLTPLPNNFFHGFPPQAWGAEENRNLGYIVARDNGLLGSYLQALRQYPSPSGDWTLLCEAVEGKNVSHHEFSSPSAIRLLTEIVSATASALLFRYQRSAASKIAITKMLSLPKVRYEECGGDEQCILYHIIFPPVRKIPRELILFCNSEVVMAKKPYGVDTRSFASGVLRTLRLSRTFFAPLLLPTSGNGIFFLCSCELRLKWVYMKLCFSVNIAPSSHNSSEYVPLLSSKFYEKYCAKVLEYSSDITKRVRLSCSCEARASEAREVLDRFRLDLNAEGWIICRDDSTLTSEETGIQIDSIALRYVSPCGVMTDAHGQL